MRKNAFSGLHKAIAGGSGSPRLPGAARRLDRPTLIKGGITLLNIGLVVLTANFAAEMVWTWAQPSAGRAAIASYSSEALKAHPDDYRLLITFDPFHRQSAAPAVQASEEAARETTLDLKLFGVRAGLRDGHDDERGSAIIRTPDKKQGAFKVGDTVMEGVTLKRILPDRVVISHRGVLENLFLDEDSQTLIAVAGSRKTVTQATQNGGAGLDDSQRLMAAIQAKPRITSQGIDGFVLNPGKDKALFAELGFAPGDILLAVNGSRLDSPDRMRDLGTRLQTAQSVRLEIERDGESRIIELSNE